MTNSDSFQRHIVVIEDNANDVYLLREVLRDVGVPCKVDVLKDGDEALKYVEQIESGQVLSCPDLILLDLNLPRRNGEEVLAFLRTSLKCNSIPVIVVTSSDSQQDRDMALRLGARHYFRKPPDLDEFFALSQIIRKTWGPINQ